VCLTFSCPAAFSVAVSPVFFSFFCGSSFVILRRWLPFFYHDNPPPFLILSIRTPLLFRFINYGRGHHCSIYWSLTLPLPQRRVLQISPQRNLFSDTPLGHCTLINVNPPFFNRFSSLFRRCPPPVPTLLSNSKTGDLWSF